MADALTPNQLRDSASELTQKLNYLQAMLAMTFGEARDSFDSMNEQMRDNYLWHCSDLTQDCQTLAERLDSELHRLTADELREVGHG